MGLSIQESTMSRQIERAENRAMIRYLACDKSNVHWKIVGNLIKKHNELVSSVSSKTDALFNNETNAKDPDDENNVENF